MGESIMEINDYLNSDINNYEVLKKLVLFDFVEDTLSGE